MRTSKTSIKDSKALKDDIRAPKATTVINKNPTKRKQDERLAAARALINPRQRKDVFPAKAGLPMVINCLKPSSIILPPIMHVGKQPA